MQAAAAPRRKAMASASKETYVVATVYFEIEKKERKVSDSKERKTIISLLSFSFYNNCMRIFKYMREYICNMCASLREQEYYTHVCQVRSI